jgi:hypothetical protein
VGARIFVMRAGYNPSTRELVAAVPEGTVYLRLNRVMFERDSLRAAVRHVLRHPCERKPPTVGGGGKGRRDGGGDGADELRGLLDAVLRGRDVDICKIAALLRECECREACDCDGGGSPGDGGGEATPGSGGLGDGPGSDGWCRFKPVQWLPVDFEYRVVPNPAYAGQFGPMPFDDPWWKVVLIVLAILLAVASIIYDYIFAGQDPDFVIGTISAKSDRTTSNVDAGLVALNGSRARDFGVLDAQSDDRNNNLPIDGTVGGNIEFDRTDNGDRGIADALPGAVVFKSGARSATTRGTVMSVSYSTSVDGILYTNQVRVLPLAAPNDQPLSQGGDSGSLWIDLTSLRPVALNFAGTANDDGTEAIANPIRDVVNLLNIHFNA